MTLWIEAYKEAIAPAPACLLGLLRCMACAPRATWTEWANG